MFKYLGLLILISFVGIPLRAQDEPAKMTPELAFTFPVTQVGHDVTVKYPVFVNPAVVVKPGMVLRVIYIPPIPSDDSENLILAHHGTMEQAYSRDTMKKGDEPSMPPEIAHAIEGFRRTVWGVPINFQLALAQMPTDQIHLIYSPTGKSQDLSDQKVGFFEGMLIGLPDGKVTVLAVENSSRSDKAGFKAGDEIVTVAKIPVQNSLETFANAYLATRSEARETNAPSFPFTVRSPGKSETHIVNLPMPPTLKANLMDGF